MGLFKHARAVLCAIAALAVMAGLAIGAAASADDVHGVARVAGKPQKDVVVWLDGVQGSASEAPGRVVLDQRNLTFLPHVLAVRVGTRVEMPNNDRVFHNVFSFKDGKSFDLGLYPVGTIEVVSSTSRASAASSATSIRRMAAYVDGGGLDALFGVSRDADGASS